MSEEEVQRIRQLIREELAKVVSIQAADGIRITRLEETAQTLLAITQQLVALQVLHDERMDNLVRAVERYVLARGSNGSGGA